jgi:hypothetical protein
MSNYKIKEETKREIVINFENDTEYCEFIKSLRSAGLSVAQEIFRQEYEKILDKSELLSIYQKL